MAKKYSVEIVVPIYNEAKELKTNILKLYTYLKKNLEGYNFHITIADNASTDSSLTIAQALSKKYKEIGYIHLDLKGRGRAVKEAWQKSQADILSYMDVDLSTDLTNFLPMIDSLIKRGYDIAIGSRLLPNSKVLDRPLKREILSRGYNILIKLLFQVHFSDAQCGFKAITSEAKRRLLAHIIDNAWFFDSELLIVGEKMGYRIYEQPVEWIDNPGSTVRVLRTVYGDLEGLFRLLITQPWRKKK
jgi:glycosyltransferase involved in cell wall biosynthesis